MTTPKVPTGGAAAVPPYAGRPHDGQFTSYDQWCDKAKSWIGGMDATCFDAKGRPMLAGLDFMRARDEGAFPVRFWLPRESAYWQRMHGDESAELARRLQRRWILP